MCNVYIILCIIYINYCKSYRISAIRGSQYYDPRSVSEQHNYREYSLPVVDYYEIFSKHLENSDSLMDVYKFQDKSGRDLALRPEITPQLLAMVNDQWNNYDKPLRWFTIADCWRYERPCSGRRRNHKQWNLDLISSISNMDVEPLLIMIQAFQTLGFTSNDIKISINSTEFIEAILEMIGSKADISQFTRILDKFNRIAIDEFTKELEIIGFSKVERDRLLDYLSIKDSNVLLETFNSDVVKSTLDVLKSLGLDDWMSLDLTIARGNGYYKGMVYEAFDKNIKRRAIAGGGHYQMKNTLNNDIIECCGFGMGDIVLLDLMYERNLLPDDLDI